MTKNGMIKQLRDELSAQDNLIKNLEELCGCERYKLSVVIDGYNTALRKYIDNERKIKEQLESDKDFVDLYEYSSMPEVEFERLRILNLKYYEVLFDVLRSGNRDCKDLSLTRFLNGITEQSNYKDVYKLIDTLITRYVEKSEKFVEVKKFYNRIKNLYGGYNVFSYESAFDCIKQSYNCEAMFNTSTLKVGDLEKKNKDYKGKVESLTKNLQALEQKVSESNILQAENKTLHAEIESLQTIRDELREELEQKLIESNILQDENKTLHAEIESLQTIRDELREELEQKVSESRGYKDELDNVVTEFTEFKKSVGSMLGTKFETESVLDGLKVILNTDIGKNSVAIRFFDNVRNLYTELDDTNISGVLDKIKDGIFAEELYYATDEEYNKYRSIVEHKLGIADSKDNIGEILDTIFSYNKEIDSLLGCSGSSESLSKIKRLLEDINDCKKLVGTKEEVDSLLGCSDNEAVYRIKCLLSDIDEYKKLVVTKEEVDSLLGCSDNETIFRIKCLLNDTDEYKKLVGTKEDTVALVGCWNTLKETLCCKSVQDVLLRLDNFNKLFDLLGIPRNSSIDVVEKVLKSKLNTNQAKSNSGISEICKRMGVHEGTELKDILCEIDLLIKSK
ncbi:MAG: hypothetical protein K2P14_01880, partial [Anaeroplasmataceae bacterium]|nr:hypothetical protein [Anaeroplasmataceae bacterium]